jgi:hypothetical protein
MLLLCSVPRRTKRPPRIWRQKRWRKGGSLRHAAAGRHLSVLLGRKLEQEYEVQMLLKTDLAHQQALLDCLKSHHPYQTPELLVLPVTHGDNDYLSWLTASLR